ncbi:unnamed protein product [Calicophoron daubneyi]|uniref:Cadherin domain-containing protein n=1 Tax=Calicophoron daubneyi TaxID=300641 RepID=A0AAV2TCH6_CALDB
MQFARVLVTALKYQRKWTFSKEDTMLRFITGSIFWIVSLANKPPQFLQEVSSFTLGARKDNLTLGKLRATDVDPPSSDCGRFGFRILGDPSEYPISVNQIDGEVRTNRMIETFRGAAELNIPIEVYNFGEFSSDTSSGILKIDFADEDDSFTKVEEALHRAKRSVDASSEARVDTTVLSPKPYATTCGGCNILNQVEITLPAGTNSLVIQMFGSASGFSPEVSEVVMISKGSSVTISDQPISTTNRKNTGEFMSYTLNYSSVTVDSQEDCKITFQYCVSIPETAPISAKFSFGTLINIGNNSNFSPLDSQVSAPRNSTLSMTTCPTSFYPGTIDYLVAEADITKFKGDYMIAVESLTPGASILQVWCELGNDTLISTPLDIVYLKTDDVRETTVTIPSRRLSISKLVNKYSGEDSLSERQKIRIHAVIQAVAKPSMPPSIRVVGIFPSSTVLTAQCDPLISPIDDSFSESPNPTIKITAMDTTIDAGKMKNVEITVGIQNQTRESYYLNLTLGGSSHAELGPVYMRQGDKAELPLVATYVRSGVTDLLRSENVFLGLLNNTDTSVMNKVMRASVVVRTSAQTDEVVEFSAKICWSTGCGTPETLSFRSGNMFIPPADAVNPTSKSELVQPARDHFLKDFNAVTLHTITFSADTVYPATKMFIEFHKTDVKIVDYRIDAMGTGLSLVAAGLTLYEENSQVGIQFQSIYAEAGSSEANRSVAIRLVVKSAAEFCVTVRIESFVNSSGDALCVKMNKSIYSFMPREKHIPELDVALKNLDGSGVCPQNGLITVLATMAIQPNAPQTYGFSAYTSLQNTDLLICKPRLLRMGSLIGAANEHTTDEDNKQEVSLSSVIHDGNATKWYGLSGMIHGFNTISYVIPYIVGAIPLTRLKNKIDMSYNSSKTDAIFWVKVTEKNATESKDPQCDAGLVHVLDYNVRSTEAYSDPVAPGEAIRFYYDIVFPSESCSAYSVVVQHANDEKWPVDVGRIFMQGHGESIWCISDEFEAEMQKSETDPQLFIRGSLDLGRVCAKTRGDTWVRVTGFLRPWWKNPKPGFEEIDIQRMFSIFIEKEGAKLSSTEKNIIFTVNSANAMAYSERMFQEDYDIKIEPTKIQASPGEDVDITVTIRLPPARKIPNSKIILGCPKVDGQSEAHCIMEEVRLSFGTDFVRMNNEKFKVDYKSEFDNFQKNQATIELGNLVETGAKRSLHLADVNASDIKVFARLKITDSRDTLNESDIGFTVWTLFDSVNRSANLSINVKRSGTEKVLIDFQARIANDGKNSFRLGDTFRMDVFMAMLPDSQRECTERRLRVQYKPFFSPPKLIAQNSTGTEFTKADEFTLKAGVFHFGENANLTLELRVSAKPATKRFTAIILTAELDCLVYDYTSTPAQVAGSVGRFVSTVEVCIGSETCTTDPCEIDMNYIGSKDGPLPRDITEESRTYLHVEDTFYFCYPELDTTGRNVTKKRCFVTNDNLDQIRDLGPYVSQIVGVIPSKKILLGVGKDAQSLILSRDDGKNWKTINLSAYKYLINQSTDKVMAESVPWTMKAGTFDPSTTGTNCTEYASKPWNICFGGIYNNGSLVVEWGDSCKAVHLDAN